MIIFVVSEGYACGFTIVVDVILDIINTLEGELCYGYQKL